MNVAVLFDEAPQNAAPDLADNTVQAVEVKNMLVALGHRVETVAMAPDRDRAAAELAAMTADLVFNLVEAPGGQGRLIAEAPAVLDEMGVPYTGAGFEAMRVTSKKTAAKGRLRGAGLPTPDWVEADGSCFPNADAGRYIIKSVWEHGSVGLGADSVVTGGSVEMLLAAMERHRPFLGGECFAEAYVEGREFNISLLDGPVGPLVLPPAEILFTGFPEGMNRIVSYNAKWTPTAYEYANTPRCFSFGPGDRPLVDAMADLSLACWRLFDLHGWARVDFRVDGRGRPLILEVNANPCLSADAGFMAAAARCGLTRGEVVRSIVDEAVGRYGLNQPGNS